MVNENHTTCKKIAQALEVIAQQQAYQCPICEGIIRHEKEDRSTCASCGSTFYLNELEPYSMFDYLCEAYDTEYCINEDGSYRSVCVMIGCGTSNIYVDTADCEVKLYHQADRVQYGISLQVARTIDAVCKEMYRCL